jgi:hypothetical protein
MCIPFAYAFICARVGMSGVRLITARCYATQKMDITAYEQYAIFVVAYLFFAFVQFLTRVVTRTRCIRVFEYIKDHIPSFNVKSEFKKTFTIICCALLFYHVSRTGSNDLQIVDIPERPMYSSCVIDKWGEYTSKPTKKCYDVCVDVREAREQAVSLMHHMQLYIPAGHEFVTANEFGSNSRNIYSRRYKHIMNANVTSHGKDVKWVKCMDNTISRYTSIHVSYLDYNFQRQEREFTNLDALNLQCTFIMLSI